jgi:eukaryotic-like serine/threonine-protein kinase
MTPGMIIAGRYRLDRPLGEGGMGAVWAATHTVTQRTHALKLLKKKDDDPATRKRMLREARAASAVRHANVVTVHDVVEGPDGAPVLVMDLLEGESLGDRLEREKRLDLGEALRIARAILEALEAAHAAGVVHRDLKPDNVFLTKHGLKVLDFGIAKLTANEGPGRATTNMLTESGAVMGTPSYMAPEQAFGEGEIDARADLWALGVVLYECIAGARPVDGTTVGQIFKSLATGAIVPLESRVPDVPSDVAGLVRGLLTIDRNGRPSSARAALDALDRIDATSTGAPVHIPRLSEKRPKRAPIAIAVALAAVASGTLFFTMTVKRPVTSAAAATATTSAIVVEAPPPPPAVVNEPQAPTTAPVPIRSVKPSPVPKSRPAASPAAPASAKPATSQNSKLLTDVPF